MRDSAAAVYGTLLQLGYTVTPCGDRIQVIPDNIPRELLDRLVRQREGVLALARMAGRGKGQEESFAGLKALLPSLWEPVRLPNGETGVLLGGHGAGRPRPCLSNRARSQLLARRRAGNRVRCQAWLFGRRHRVQRLARRSCRRDRIGIRHNMMSDGVKAGT